MFKVGDYIVMSWNEADKDIREIDKLLENGRVCVAKDGRILRLSLSNGYKIHRHATQEEIKIGHRL